VQVTPHAPQSSGSICVYAHPPPHSVCPARHRARHAPREHTSVPLQTTLHPPQLFGSLLMSVHTPLHNDCPGKQLQFPDTHVVPPVHAWPQVPQFAGDRVTSTHAPPQFVYPAVQLAVQTPLSHASLAAHA
jgi:hypothetical protein